MCGGCGVANAKPKYPLDASGGYNRIQYKHDQAVLHQAINFNDVMILKYLSTEFIAENLLTF